MFGFDARTLLAIFGAVVAHTISVIFFKFAAEAKGRRILILFGTGITIGLGHMICLMFALKGNDPKLVTAVMGSMMGVITTITLNRVFKERLSIYQWLGIVVLMIGTSILVNIEPPGESKDTKPAQVSIEWEAIDEL